MSNTYVDLNAELNLYAPDGTLQLEKDHEAARAYFLEYVNVNTRFFHDLEEKVEFLTENDFWSKETLAAYSPDFVKKAFKQAYDHKFRFPSFMGAYKFYTSYALKSNDGKTILERYEDRVVMCALHLARGDRKLALSLIDEIITGRYQPATPTFQNAGKARGGEQVSCFLLNASDSLDSIQATWGYAAQLSKIGGGVAICLSNLRERGAALKGKEGLAKGVINWMKIYEDIFSTVDQLGTRPGAGAVYLSIHHPDILDFLDCKRENADEKMRIKTLSTGVVIPDITFELAKRGEEMYLFSPYDVAREYGKPFTEIDITEMYQEMVDNPRIHKKKTDARKLLQLIAELQFESGYPYMLFSDTANRANPVPGTISMSNLCVTGDATILTDKGYRKAEDLYRSQEDFDVLVDKRARDMDLSHRGISQETSTRMALTATNADVYKVSTFEGFNLRATLWHKMYVVRDGELIKIPLAEVEVGDKLLVQSEKGRFGTVHEPDLAYLAGVIAADGSMVANTTSAGNQTVSARINLYGDKDQFADAVLSSLRVVLKDREDLCDRQSTMEPEFVPTEYNRLTLTSAPLAKLLKEKGMEPQDKVTVPKFVAEGDKETQIAFLNGVFQLDGTVTGTLDAGNAGIELGNIHEEFLQQIQKLLLNLGIYSRIYFGHEEREALLPDGHGGYKLYTQKAIFSLRISARRDRELLYPLINWKKDRVARWNDLYANMELKKRPYDTHKFLATVKAVEFDGVEDVYDVTVENGHSVIFNGIATGNCSEILQTSTPSTFDEKSGKLSEVGRDISCNLGSLNVYNAMLSPDFAKTIDTSMRALTAVSDMTDIERVPTVKHANDVMHSVGLGQMSLATFFATHEMYYGDKESLDFTNNYYMAVNYWTLVTSCKIAQERRGTFEGFKESSYYDGSYFDQYLGGEEIAPKTEKVRKLFEESSVQLPTQEDWAELKERVHKHGLWHAWRMATAPTGSISYINYASPSILPVTSLIEIRKEGALGRVYAPAPHLSEENKKYYVDAYTVGPQAIIDVYAEATKHNDQGLSCTLHFLETATTRDLTLAHLHAWRKGLKTLYYSRFRSVESFGGSLNVQECVSCSI